MLRKLVADNTPEPLKMPCALWTRAAVAQLIEQQFGIRLPFCEMGLYLARWGSTPQKPMKKACEQSPAALRTWLGEDHPVIAARAKAEGAEIHLGDDSGLRSDDVYGRGIVPKGQTPVIRVNNKRPGFSVICTFTNKGQMRWCIVDGALNTDILIDVLRRSIKGASKKLFLVLDHLRVSHAKPVKAWLEENADAVEVFYLSSYSPELNPDEMANAGFKQAVAAQAPARTKLQLVKATARHMGSMQGQPERIRKYFEHRPVRYAA